MIATMQVGYGQGFGPAIIIAAMDHNVAGRGQGTSKTGNQRRYQRVWRYRTDTGDIQSAHAARATVHPGQSLGERSRKRQVRDSPNLTIFLRR